MFCRTPRSSPPTNAIGIERSPASATAASEPSTIRVNSWSASWNSGAIRMPPRPASIIVRTHAADDVRDALTPRRPARSLRFTTARISSPRRVWRRTSHSAIAANAAATKTATWSELSETPLSPIESRCHIWRGLGPMPRTVPLPVPVVTGRPKSSTVLPNASTSHERQRRERDEQADRPDDPRVHRRRREAPQQDPVEGEAEQRGEDQHRDQRRRHDRHTEAGVQLEEDVGGDERDRAVREVEDPRGLVRQHHALRP